jgi:ABC-type antimicrobial peptide transport system permease subunit
MFWGQKRRIVGVVADEKFEGPGAETPPAVYPPIWQVPMSAVSLLVRTHSDPMEVLPQLRAVARDLDPQVALYGVTTMDEALSQSIGKQRFTMRLLGAFAMLALVLAMIGVHGTLSYAVTQRAREMGIRMALGAQRSAVHFMILRQGMLLSLLGIAAGVVGALAATRLLRTLLYGLTATDVATYVAVASVIAIVSALASILPARRATGIDPAVTLRAE